MTGPDVRLPDGTGLSPCGSSQQAVSPVPASIPDAGDWVVYKRSDFSGLLYRHGQVGKVTAKQVRLVAAYWDKVITRSDVVAVCATKKEAETIREAIGGAYGEYKRRCRRAEAIRDDAVNAARIAFERQANKLIAQAIEARRAATLGAVHESAVPKECAPTPTPKSED